MPPDLPCVKDGFERAYRQQGVHVKACPAKIPCGQRAHGRGEARWSAVHAEAWQGAGRGDSSGYRATRVRRKVERETRFNLVAHDPDALFNIIDQQRRDQAVIEATDAARRQKGTRREARSVAAAGTKLQGNAADKPEGSQSAKTAGVKACLLYTSPSPRDLSTSRMPSSA